MNENDRSDGAVVFFVWNIAGFDGVSSRLMIASRIVLYDSTDYPDDWSKKQRRDRDERGYSFALQVRKLLPDTIDLFYYDWYPKKKVVRKKIEYLKNKYFEYKERCPMIVFNERCLMENKI